MACIIQFLRTDKRESLIRRGNEPRQPATWTVVCWFVLPNGEKHTHSTTAHKQTADTLFPWMGALIDTLLEDHGDTVTSAGWTCTAHGASKHRKKRK